MGINCYIVKKIDHLNYYKFKTKIGMKKHNYLFLLTSVLLLGIITFSCNNGLLVNSTDDLMLKKAQNSALTDLELLGKNIYFDKISEPGNMACADCHSPKVGFTGPVAGINVHGSVYRGAVAQRFGDRRPPTAAYGGNSPVLHFDDIEGLWIGGMFWDGRATGWTLGDPLAEQALGPFLNPVEQNNPDALTVLKKIAGSKYVMLWEKLYGALSLDPADVAENYVKVGRAIAAFERSSDVSAFTSKFDSYLQGKADLTENEKWGLELFNGKGMCNACHLSEGPRPLFTDFSFDNLGVPKNPENPMYKTHPDFIDPGLGGFLKAAGYPESVYMAEMGKHKVPTLRNVDKRPGIGFPKDYAHNGYFKSLKEIVHFYNTRDVEEWPAPELAVNVNSDELGNLGLTDAEEDAIIAFMRTLSDGY
jgi:cytochrome c peroxidase